MMSTHSTKFRDRPVPSFVLECIAVYLLRSRFSECWSYNPEQILSANVQKHELITRSDDSAME